MLQNHLMLGGSYRQTFFQMDKSSQLQQMIQLILVGITKAIDATKIFKWTINEYLAYWIADSSLQSRVESLMRKSNSEFSVCYNVLQDFQTLFLFSWKYLDGAHVLISWTFQYSSGGYIADEWTGLCIPVSRLYRWKDEDKAVSRMDHKGERIIFDIHAGI